MNGSDFALDPRLSADTLAVASLPMCEVRLMDDARYAWLVVVPRRGGVSEVADLSERDQATLWQEVGLVTAALRRVAPCEKINIGALGNSVRQLHVHVVARNTGDAAWPGPVWGNGKAGIYDPPAREALINRLTRQLTTQE